MMTYNGPGLYQVMGLWLGLMLVMASTMLLFLDHGFQASLILGRLVMLVSLEYGSLELKEVRKIKVYCIANISRTK